MIHSNTPRERFPQMTLSITQPSGPLGHPTKVKIHPKGEPPPPTQIVLGEDDETSVDEELPKSLA